MAAIANVVVATDTFENWVSLTNQAITRLNSITVNGNTITSNTITSNTITGSSFIDTPKLHIASGAVTLNATHSVFNTATFTISNDTLNISANTTFNAKATFNGANTLIASANLDVTGVTLFHASTTVAASFYVTGTTTLGDYNFGGGTLVGNSTTTTITSTLALTGLNTTAQDAVGAINEVNDNIISFAIALG